MPESRGCEGRNALHRALPCGIGRGRYQGIVATPRGRAVRREHTTGEEAEIVFLQLLRVFSLMWWLDRGHPCCLDRRQQGLAMGVRNLHAYDIVVDTALPSWF